VWRRGGWWSAIQPRLSSLRLRAAPSLEAFLIEGSIHGAAEQLRMHRSSVKYRLKRIEELTHIDLEDAETRFLVQLALRAHRRLATDSA